MPLVFVHGVNVRNSGGYQRTVDKHRELFAKIALRGLADGPTILHPYWGGNAAQPAWDNASVPDGDYESFGADDQLALVVNETTGVLAPEDPILILARTDFLAAVDLLWTLVPDDRAGPDLAELGAKAVAYAEALPNPAWLADVTNDAQFLTRLGTELDLWTPVPAAAGPAGAWESFGLGNVWDSIREGAGRLVTLPGRAAGGAVVAATRSKVHKVLSRFIGDILVYLDARDLGDGSPGPIPTIVIDAVEAAIAQRSPDDPHVVALGHSMGGNILYDILTHYRPDLRLDALVTVGSQVGMLEELKVFHASRGGVPSAGTPRVAAPANAGHWINVFDRQDILSFSGRAIFEPIEDFEYSTGATVLGAHTTYFDRPSFHKRLNERLTAALEP